MTNREALLSLADKWDAEGGRLFEQSWRGDSLTPGGVYRDTMTVTLSELCKDFAISLRALAQPKVPQP